MTKIKRYAIDTEVTGSDKWIGSDGNAMNRTKNFTPVGLADFLNKSRMIQMPNALTFKYDTVDEGDDRSRGSISFASELGAIVNMSVIESFMIHQRTTKGKVSVNFLQGLLNNLFIIQKSSDPDHFGVFKMTSYEQNVDEPEFYDVECEFIQGNGSIEEDEDYFVSLLQVDVLSDKHYTHNQNNASAVWNVTHNLQKHPSVSVVLSTGQQGLADVQYINNNELTITLLSAQSGKAYLN
jgi:hypothetical protein